MSRAAIHRFELNGKRFALDPETCFCFECDAISWDVLAHYPHASMSRILHLLGDRYDARELAEVVGELEWLRATKSILSAPSLEDMQKLYKIERGLSRLTVRLSPGEDVAETARRRWFARGSTRGGGTREDPAREAVGLLLSRSGEQRELHLEFLTTAPLDRPERVAALCGEALRAAGLAGKTLTAALRLEGVELSDAPEALRGHTVSARLEFRGAESVAEAVEALAGRSAFTLARLAKALQGGDAAEVSGRVIVRPDGPEFGGVAEALHGAGFAAIELDVDGAFAAHPDLSPEAMRAGLSETAVYYARSLLDGRYFRLDPIAPLFWRIYNGTPQRRTDPVGTNELAIDGDGGVYPSWRLLGQPAFRLGSVGEGAVDEERVKSFDDVGALTTSACIQCWARNLCGGGVAAVHQALTGDYRTPSESWCASQRDWLSSAVSAFHLLSSSGVNFARMYQSLNRTARPSFFTALRAAFRMTIGVRPVEEADAALLTRWENWNEATYFTCTESGVLLATRYDREMDALHPSGASQELFLIRRDGSVFGLVRLRPEAYAGVARLWVYLHRRQDYAADDIRKGFRALLREAAGQQSIRKVVAPAAVREPDLCQFLEAVGFQRSGVEREALYLHGQYHDVALYEALLDEA